jgi:AcrR family transcriptional regulator
MGRVGRRTGEETRALLLRVGLEMLFERGASAGVQHIRLQEVLRRAGLTTGAAYRLWADQTDYQRDLAVAMVRLRFTDPVENASSAIDRLIADGADLDDVIRAAAETHAIDSERRQGGRGGRDTEAFLIALALRATGGTSPELRSASRERHDESIEGFVRFYGRLMDAYGMRMRTPYTIRDFTEAMAALGEGFAIHSLEGIAHPRLEIGDEHEGPTGRWSLFGIAVRGLVHEFMTPDPGRHPGSGPNAGAAPGPDAHGVASRDRTAPRGGSAASPDVS